MNMLLFIGTLLYAVKAFASKDQEGRHENEVPIERFLSAHSFGERCEQAVEIAKKHMNDGGTDQEACEMAQKEIKEKLGWKEKEASIDFIDCSNQDFLNEFKEAIKNEKFSDKDVCMYEVVLAHKSRRLEERNLIMKSGHNLYFHQFGKHCTDAVQIAKNAIKDIANPDNFEEHQEACEQAQDEIKTLLGWSEEQALEEFMDCNDQEKVMAFEEAIKTAETTDKEICMFELILAEESGRDRKLFMQSENKELSDI